MSETMDLKSLIQNTKLTKKEQIIADFVLDNFMEACFMTSTDIASHLGVSDSSVIRFTRSLGFSGFMDFQHTLRDIYAKNSSLVSDTITVPSERLKQSISHMDKGDLIETHFLNVLGNMKSAITKNATETFERATDILIGSHRKFIIASRANTGSGDNLLLLLKHTMPNVHMTSYPALNVIDHLSDIEEGDCAIIISFPRYSKMDYYAAQMVKDAGAKIILVTDKATAPMAHFADILFTVDVNSDVFFNSYASVQFLLETLACFVSRKVGCSNEEKLQKIDKYISPLGVY